jgi:inner membrane protein
LFIFSVDLRGKTVIRSQGVLVRPNIHYSISIRKNIRIVHHRIYPFTDEHMIMVLPDLGLSLGWLLIATGAALLLIEVYSPGFFATVPATVMIFIGILLLLGVDIFNSPWGVVIGVVIALLAAGFTVWMYGKITPNNNPTTISRDSVVGLEGRVKLKVDPTTLSGKVLIGTTEWSARSTGAEITAGKKVKVTDSEGVHIVVEEVC